MMTKDLDRAKKAEKEETEEETERTDAIQMKIMEERITSNDDRRYKISSVNNIQ